MIHWSSFFPFFFFNDTATTEIYTLSLHDALPIYFICGQLAAFSVHAHVQRTRLAKRKPPRGLIKLHARNSQVDRKSTRLNSSHGYISYAVFCLKKKKIDASIHPGNHHGPQDTTPP